MMKQVSVIGISRSGKTCYLYAMAKTMLRGYGGVNVNAIHDTASMELKKGWREIRREATWPKGTDVLTKTEFNCSLNLRPVMDFVWNDFKGGTLTSLNEVDVNFRQEFEQFLESSDGLVIFVASDELQDILHEVEDSDLIVDDLDSLTEIFLRNKVKLARIPVTIVISKADILSEEEKEFAFEMVTLIFKPLFTPGNNMRVLVAPVSIGANLGRCSQGEKIQGTVFQNPNDGNIHIPILFNLYHFLKDSIAIAKVMLGEYENDAQNMRRELDIANNHNAILRFFMDRDRDLIRDDISSARNSAKEKLAQIKNLERELDKVVSLFSGDCKYYINGQIVNL